MPVLAHAPSKEDLQVRLSESLDLYDACMVNDFAEVERLLTKGVSPNIYRSKAGTSSLIEAATNGYERVVQLLIEYGADCTARNSFGETPLDAARKAGHKKARSRSRASLQRAEPLTPSALPPQVPAQSVTA